MTKKIKFKAKNSKFFIIDKIKLESIFTNVNCKKKEIRNK